MVTIEAKTFLLAGQQLQENFSRLVTINDSLKEAKIDLSQLDKRLARYDKLFDNMLETPAKGQDWSFIISELNDNLKELNTYFDWIADTENYDIQISKQELDRLIAYKNTVKTQIKKLNKIIEVLK